jgi:hypothetical protein
MHTLHFVAVAVAIARTTNAMLNEIAQEKGKLDFGTATDNPELNDTKYDRFHFCEAATLAISCQAQVDTSKF